MNKIQKVIEDSKKEFDKNFSNFNLNDHAIYNGRIWFARDLMKSYIYTTISNILSTIEEEVENDIDGDETRCRAFSNIQKLLKQTKEQIK